MTEIDKIVAFDNDGVVPMTVVAVLAEVQRRWGVAIRPSEVKSYDGVGVVARDRTGRPELYGLANKLWLDPAVVRQAPITPGMDVLLNNLILDGWKPYVITSRPADNYSSTMEWYEEHLPFFPRKNIKIRRVEDGTASMSGDPFKSHMLGATGARKFFEDYDVTARMLAKDHPNVDIRLVNQPWNLHERELDDLRVFGPGGIGVALGVRLSANSTKG